MIKKNVILATASPYRIAVFDRLGVPYEVEVSNVEENFEVISTNPATLVLYLARLKAEAVAERRKGANVIVGFDSVDYFDRSIFKKPQSRLEAYERLKALSGKQHQFYTGIYVIDLVDDKAMVQIVKTSIKMRNISELEIDYYLSQDANYDTSELGYNPLEGYGATFAKSISGSYNNYIRGIPTEVVAEMLKGLGVSC